MASMGGVWPSLRPGGCPRLPWPHRPHPQPNRPSPSAKSPICPSTTKILTGSQGVVRCSRCGGRGSVTCRRCNGRGRIDCATCATHGRLIQARFRIHDFRKRSLARFASGGRHTNNFNNFEQGLRNELVEKDFAGFRGELVQEDEQKPESHEVVRQRRRIESFGVSSYQFQYGKMKVTVNQINGAGGSHRLSAPVSLPISLRRLSITVIAGIALFIGTILLLGLLAG